MARFVPISELPTSGVLSQSITGNEPNLQFAFQMMEERSTAFYHDRVLWDVLPPSGMDDACRVELNMTRIGLIRQVGGISLLHFKGSQDVDSQLCTVHNDGVEGGFRLDFNMVDVADRARSRYMYYDNLLHSKPVGLKDPEGHNRAVAQDLFFAQALEDTLRLGFARANVVLRSPQARAVRTLARLPGLVRTTGIKTP